MLLSDIWQLQTEADDLEAELSAATKLTAKYMEKSDQVQAVEAWLADQVDWLAELSELSNRLPDGSDASVRRLSASASGKGASIDISVEANSQETISQLENRIRGAKYSAVSKQISQNADSEEYPWRFETQISFELEPPRPKLFGPPEPPSDQPSKETTDQPSSEGSQ
jgi:Tfp pilus assembly protein PilN